MKTPLLIAAVLSPVAAWANGGGYTYTYKNGEVGLFQPKNAEQVEMQTELLNIELGANGAKVAVEYTMHNPGKAVTVEAAFPCSSEHSMMGLNGGENPPPLEHFAVSADGEALKFRVVNDAPAKPPKEGSGPSRPVAYWYVFKLSFKAGQTLTFKASYDSKYSGGTYSVSDNGSVEPATLTYLFSTAAVWKGPIQSGKVTVRAADVDPDQVKFNLPKRFTRAGKVWTWEFTDLEPGLGDDLKIVAKPLEEFHEQTLHGVKDAEGNPVYVQYVGIAGKWEMRHRLYDVQASSTMAAQGDLTYDAKNVREYSDAAWAEGAQDDGLGESLTLTLQQPRKLSHLEIRNGYHKQPAAGGTNLYLANNRVAEFGVSINGGKTFTVALPDEPTYRLPLPADGPEVKTLRLIIQKVYPGTKYHDTCISGISLVTPLSKKPKIDPVR